MCVEIERPQAVTTRQEHDLEEIRLLFARYRRAVAFARKDDIERTIEAEPEPGPDRVPVGAST